MRKLLQKLHRDEDGAAMAEYAVLLGLITVALILTIQPMAAAIGAVFANVTAVLAPLA